ncbi:hypothetical protein TVAG_306170 [Trichomonas vaginalis G3]|uniref:Uncharacterized protein n=1 Tax=Trichomonas vaginalis (strain ATCC PRA-98 / G3) TaxID=412133 RepID=A2DNA8_TRIV3|nr:hypothetical protein TVAG_306170 [Trichomonas vaginalis G3]|eukprot:XP_001579082.1 hypothetical protein [Trichomonas vaginalis G3]
MEYTKTNHILRLFFDSAPNIDIWKHYYGNENIPEYHTKSEVFSQTKEGNYHVTACFFNGFEEVVVNINEDEQTDTRLLISISGFNGTKTPSSTVYSKQGNCVIYRTCATKSIPILSSESSLEGIFLYSNIENSNNKNILEDSTVFDCGDTEKGKSICYLEKGNLSFSRNNITNNKCNEDVSLSYCFFKEIQHQPNIFH